MTICLGNNYDDLKGCENDAILFYNLIYNFKIKNNKDKKIDILQPYIFLDKEVKISTIKKSILDKIKIFESDLSQLIIFYSGHGYSNGYFGIYNDNNKFITYNNFLNEINNILIHNIDLLLIIDSCYSGLLCNFNNIDNYKNIKNLRIISSCDKDETSNETICSFVKLIKEKKIKNLLSSITTSNDIMPIGLFSFNFINIIYHQKLSFDTFNLFIKDKIWKKLAIILSQNPKIIW